MISMAHIREIKDYDKIAAGEVIERPASIVKELLENSIDAGASRVQVVVKKAGKQEIEVIDDGNGIPAGELKLAFEKHTTSKIGEFSDIYDLHTLGFRGEALASIKAVARVEMISKPGNQEMGRKIVFENNALVEERDVSAPDGTTVTVKHLFKAIPVRRKFLKKDSVEFAHISDIVTRYALAYHALDIKLIHNGRKVLDAPPSNGNLLNTIASIYGNDHAINMLPVENETDSFSLKGFIAKPCITRSSRSYASLFVNKRHVHSLEILKAVEDAYRGRIMKNRYPFFVLFLEMDPASIDVNIHPTKKEIKFASEKELVSSVRSWIRETLDASIHVPSTNPESLDAFTAQASKSSTGMRTSVSRQQQVHAGQGNAGLKPTANEGEGTHSELDTLIDSASKHVHAGILDDGTNGTREWRKQRTSGNGDDATIQGHPPAGGSTSTVSGWKPLIAGKGTRSIPDKGMFEVLPPINSLWGGFQLNDTYLCFEVSDDSGDLVIVDQHAASERIMYERVKKLFKDKGLGVQELLVPKPLSLPPNLLPLLGENLGVLQQFGFEIVEEPTQGKESKSNRFLLLKIPFIFNRKVDMSIIEDFLEDILCLEGDALQETKDEILKSFGCHSAIRAGERLSRKQAWRLLQELDQCDDPQHCAHGRPTFIRIKRTWLEREFKRTA
ncbi:DNA mismatch repair endonuclease MutL [Candidatus Bathyarchaeota archaeon]|nr:DNA mismatch repair endonuclease MutL [Candidatus Bathyarchaeota archaeon]